MRLVPIRRRRGLRRPAARKFPPPAAALSITRLAAAQVAAVSFSGASKISSSCTCSSMLALSFSLRQRGGHADHGAADDVGGGALDRRVDGGALGPAAKARNLGIDLADMDAPPEQGFDKALSRANSLVASI